MNLSAPTQLIFIISLVIAIIGVLAALGVLAFIPLNAAWIVVIAYIVLAAGCLMRGAKTRPHNQQTPPTRSARQNPGRF
ncbi:hypothetical protein NKJ36_14650 [Mesorhizobium sp. M0142]|uniref:hypothetical protein n=2 Tax=Mesorhizobium TaxID=68287 RepID=UPI003335A886